MGSAANSSRRVRMERYFGDNVDGVERTERIRRRSGFKQNGRLRSSPTKQRTQASKDFVHDFKHQQHALKAIERARARLDKLVEEEMIIADSSKQRTMSSPSLLDGIYTTIAQGQGACQDISARMSGCEPMAVDALEDSLKMLSDASESVQGLKDRTDVVGHPGGDVDTILDMTDDASPSSPVHLLTPIPLATTTSMTEAGIQTHKQMSEKGHGRPTMRNITNTKRWTALLPRLRRPYLQMAESRYASPTASFLADSILFANCARFCTPHVINVDCLFLECKWAT
jgi:hypothetical protein